MFLESKNIGLGRYREMKQIINIKIEKELSDQEAEYIKALSDEEKAELVKKHKEQTQEIFEDENFSLSDFKELVIEFTD